MTRMAVLLVFLGLPMGMVFAQSETAAELATQNVGPVNKVLTTSAWTPLLAADFKKPVKKDLSIAVSLECGLFTGTDVDAFADATVLVRVFLDDNLTAPGILRYCMKTNGLVPPFNGLVTCTSSSLSSCGFSSADLAEIARNLRSHHFFLLINIPKGIQHFRVEGSVEAGPTAGPAFGVIGKWKPRL
ncbi:MAG: hypothetical protein JWN74_2276 [Acidobacteriaceae bacterium]|nr:hypothetical protein [Acidobacteriaceae bacterium]